MLLHTYDYIITGSGCAGLSLVMHLLQSTELRDKNILLIDKSAKDKNDRTWCFWEKENDIFQPIVYKSWQQLLFYSNRYSSELAIHPYQYKLIRGIDFYNYCLAEINKHSNITFLQQAVESIYSDEKETYAVVNGEKIYAHYIFNSILFQNPLLQKKEYWLLQHFKGWTIETGEPAFNAEVATLMDFRTSQSRGATFFYVLPFNSNTALVEYTLFSKEVLTDEDYESALKKYIEDDLGIKTYTVKEKEFGIIPMTNYKFQKTQHNIINIGTTGGQTKASSGYTFKFIQKSSKAMIQTLAQDKHPKDAFSGSKRFSFYDSVLLYILQHNTLPGDKIFTRLFQKNKAAQVLRFLDNETSLPQEIKIISTLPAWPFLKAAIKQNLIV